MKMKISFRRCVFDLFCVLLRGALQIRRAKPMHSCISSRDAEKIRENMNNNLTQFERKIYSKLEEKNRLVFLPRTRTWRQRWDEVTQNCTEKSVALQ